MNEMKIFGKYKPNMEVLLEEDEEESLPARTSAWKGSKV